MEHFTEAVQEEVGFFKFHLVSVCIRYFISKLRVCSFLSRTATSVWVW